MGKRRTEHNPCFTPSTLFVHKDCFPAGMNDVTHDLRAAVRGRCRASHLEKGCSDATVEVSLFESCEKHQNGRVHCRSRIFHASDDHVRKHSEIDRQEKSCGKYTIEIVDSAVFSKLTNE